MSSPEAEIDELLKAVRASPTYLNLWSTYKRIKGISLERPKDQQKLLRLAVIGSSTLEPLAACIDVMARLEGFRVETFVGGFNTYRQEALATTSDMYKSRPDIVILCVDLWSMLDQKFVPSFVKLGPADRDASGRRAVEEIVSIAKTLVGNCSAMVVTNNFVVPVYTPFGVVDNKQMPGLRRFVTDSNEALEDALRSESRAFIFDLDSVAGDFGKSHITNWNTYYRGSVPFSEDFTVVLASEYMRYVRSLKGRSKKCIVLDLDNTLWGGVVGEDGYEGIKLANTYPGIEYVDFQRALLGLYNRGVILALNSKNNPDDVQRVIREHPYQVLREEHFAAVRINWQSKTQNIKELAEEIGIGLDSMVFIDDNPHERELMRQAFPEVLVPEWPKNPHLYRQSLEQLKVFDVLSLTKEDLERGAMYAGRRKRAQSEASAASLEDFLRTLELKIHVSFADDFTTPRVVQLIGKTNQFNVTTRRYTDAEVVKLRDSADSSVYCMQVTDKFGDEGLVGVAIVRKKAKEWLIDSFLMSCRVIGRSAETAFLARIVADAKKAKVGRVLGEFIPTKKNPPAQDFYERHGFKKMGQTEQGVVSWVLDLSKQTVKVPEWIRLIEG